MKTDDFDGAQIAGVILVGGVKAVFGKFGHGASPFEVLLLG